MGHVFVAEDFDFGAGETGSVDDARVVQFIGEDEVFFAEDAGDGAGVGGEAGLEDDAGFDAFEGGDLFFELHVDVHGAGDGADGAGAYTEFFGGGDGGFFEFGVVAEAEVVVGGEVDDSLAVVGADGSLLVVELAELEEGATLAEVVELGSEMGELGAFGGGTGLGMLVGGVATGGVGLLVGGLVGAGGGTALGGLTGNRDIEIPAESIVRFKLADNLVVQPA